MKKILLFLLILSLVACKTTKYGCPHKDINTKTFNK